MAVGLGAKRRWSSTNGRLVRKMATTPRLGLEYMEEAEELPHVTHDEALKFLDAAVQAVVQDAIGTPPGSPAEGVCYMVTGSPTGAWVGHANHIAAWYGGTWIFLIPQ